MLDGGLRRDLPGSRRPWQLLVVLAVALAPPGVYYAGVARAGLEVVSRGYVVAPAGQVVSGSDGPVLVYPDDRVTPVRLTVPVRNTSRFTLTVHYPHDLAYVGAFTAEWPAQRVVVSPGKVTWLSIPYASGCAAMKVAPGGVTRTIDRLPLTITAMDADPRLDSVPLPVPVRVPAVAHPGVCLPVLEPASGSEPVP